jgi:hypothetical protein
MSNKAVLENVRRYRAIASLFRQTAAFRPSQRQSLVTEAERWEHLALSELRHVRTSADKRAAEEIANREPCPNFEKFTSLFAEVQRDLDTGVRITRPFVRDAGFLKADITEGQFFILGGQIAYVAEVGETFNSERRI